MLRPFENLRGCTLAASDGEIGKVREFYLSDESWRVRYLVVATGNWLSGRDVLIIPDALGDVDAQSGTIAVDLTKEQVRKAPSTGSDKPVSRQQEEELHRYYDWNPYWVVPGAAGWGAVAPATMLGVPTGFPATVPPQLPPEAQQPPSADSGQSEGDPHLRSSAELADRYGFHAQDGEIGRVYDFVVDDEEWRVRYLVVRTGSWFGKDVLLAPDWIERISYERSEIFVNLPRTAIKQAPEYDDAAPLSRAYEQRLHDHYGREQYWDNAPAGGAAR